MNQRMAGKALTDSRSASPGILRTNQGTILKIPMDRVKAPNPLVSRFKMYRIPSRIEDEISEPKQEKAKRMCMTKKASVKIPTPTTEIPMKRSPIAPSNPSMLSLSIRTKETANIDKRIPVTMRPELNMGAAFETPRSLSAFCVQLNQGEIAIEIPMEVKAKISAMIPIQAAISGLKIFLRLKGI